MFVCLLVCLSAFYRPHDISPLCGAASEWPRGQKPSRAAPRASAGKHPQQEHACACRTTSQRKNRCADAFQKQNRTRAHAVIYVTAENFKKRGKENQHATSQVQFTVCLLLECLLSNRTESYSSQIEFAGPHGITENQVTYLHCGGEARAKKRARPRRHAERRAGKDGSRHRPGGMWIACGLHTSKHSNY